MRGDRVVVLVIAMAVVAAAAVPIHSQGLLATYRGAAKAYRDAADKATADRRPCYMEWAAYYDNYAAALERNGNPPTEPTSDPSCLGRGGSGGRQPTTIGGGVPAVSAGSSFNAAMGSLNEMAKQFFAERAATRRANLAGSRQYTAARLEWITHKSDWFMEGQKALDQAWQAEFTMKITEGPRMLAEAQRLARERPAPVVSGVSHQPSATEYYFYQLLQRGPVVGFAWGTFLQEFPDGPYAAIAKATLEREEADVKAAIDRQAALDKLLDEVDDALKTCPTPAARPKETVRCKGDLGHLFGGDYGKCELNYEYDVSRQMPNSDCRGSDERSYRFSLTDVDPDAIAADGSIVKLQSSRPVFRQVFVGQAGLKCTASIDERDEEVATVPLYFLSAAAAQEAVGKLRTVARYCQDAARR